MRIANAALIVVLPALIACQGPDVGQPCQFGNSIDNLTTVPADYAATGVTSCENLICIRSAQRATGYCSKPCVSNSDCSQSETGLVCRQLTFDQNVISSLPADVQSLYAKSLGPIGLSNYCATPLQ